MTIIVRSLPHCGRKPATVVGPATPEVNRVRSGSTPVGDGLVLGPPPLELRGSTFPRSFEHMSEANTNSGQAGDPSAEKDPSDWVTGGEPATGAQKSYLNTLAREAGEEVPDDITKADASVKIDELQEETGRGQ